MPQKTFGEQRSALKKSTMFCRDNYARWQRRFGYWFGQIVTSLTFIYTVTFFEFLCSCYTYNLIIGMLLSQIFRPSRLRCSWMWMQWNFHQCSSRQGQQTGVGCLHRCTSAADTASTTFTVSTVPTSSTAQTVCLLAYLSLTCKQTLCLDHWPVAHVFIC